MSALQSIRVGAHRIAYRTAGAGQTILLVHGFPLDHSMWHGQIEALATQSRVIAPDLPGFGASGPIEGTHDMCAFADELAQMLDELQVTEPIVFCGLSMGGYIGWEFWRRHPKKMQALIVCDSRVIADDATVRKGRELAASRVMREGVESVSESMLPKLFGDAFRRRAPEQVRRIQRIMETTSSMTVAAALRGMAVRQDFTSLLPEIDKPTLVICGEHDVISPAGEMSAFAAVIPNARYVEIPGAGHMAPMECPDAVSAAIRNFLHSGGRDTCD